jgi:signal transduction histidine kinase
MATAPLQARERLMRVLDQRNGLPSSVTRSIAQDSDGFLWFGTSAGIVRYDGRRVRRISTTDQWLLRNSGSAGTIASVGSDQRLAVWDGSAMVSMHGPDNAPLENVVAAYYTPDGALWVQSRSQLLRRAPDRSWSTIEGQFGSDFWAGETIGLTPGPESSSFGYETTAARIVEIFPDGHRRVVLHSASLPISVKRRAHGELLLLCYSDANGGELMEITSDRVRRIWHSLRRPVDMVQRGETLWISLDGGLLSLVGDRVTDRIGITEHLASGGALLVDRENTLWVGSVRGAVQFPEPDSASWTPEFAVAGRVLATSSHSVWLSGWGGMLRASRRDVDQQVARVMGATVSAPCVDRHDRMWTAVPGEFLVIDSSGVTRHVPLAGLQYGARCASSTNGGRLMPINGGLVYLGPDDDRPRRLEPLPPVTQLDATSVWRVAVVEEEIFVGIESSLCRGSERELLAGRDPRWACEQIKTVHRFEGAARMPSGAIWVAANPWGVIRSTAGSAWERIPALSSLPSLAIGAIRPSPRGGVWLCTDAGAVRVVERVDLADGWEVVERLGSWQGSPTPYALDVLEEEDGRLWVAGESLSFVPATARSFPNQPPGTVLVHALINGKPVAFDQHALVPAGHNRVDLEFSALSFRDESLLRYRLKLHADDPWSAPTPDADLRLFDLAPGRYEVEVAATLDGEHWSPAPAHFSFTVQTPLYGQWWFLLSVLTLSMGIAVMVYRVRMKLLLQLERQRVRIARDLHDELGAGLGSIGLMADLVSRPTLDAVRREEISRRISSTAAELGGSLSDLVWSLKPGATTLHSLIAHLTERGRSLFAAEEPRFETQVAADLPNLPLSLAVRRNALAIGLEALHNAAKHAQAQRVTLLVRLMSGRVQIIIRDDGQGLAPLHRSTDPQIASRSGGMGLPGMRRRAAEIGATLRWDSLPTGGTEVCLEFNPRAGDLAVSHHDATPSEPPAGA